MSPDNYAQRHRFGATASDTLQALHREVDQDFVDEGGIAPLGCLDIVESDAEQFEPVPLTDRKPDGRVAAAWVVILLSAAFLLWAVVMSLREALA